MKNRCWTTNFWILQKSHKNYEKKKQDNDNDSWILSGVNWAIQNNNNNNVR